MIVKGCGERSLVMTMLPEDFEGKFVIKKRNNSFRFFPGDPQDEDFQIWFYRRETDKLPLSEFLDSIESENIGYDKPSNQLFYRSKSGKLYNISFNEYDQVSEEM